MGLFSPIVALLLAVNKMGLSVPSKFSAAGKTSSYTPERKMNDQTGEQGDKRNAQRGHVWRKMAQSKQRQGKCLYILIRFEEQNSQNL